MLRTVLLVPVLLLAPLAAQTLGIAFVNRLEVLMPPTLNLPTGAPPCASVGVHSPTNAGFLQYRLNAAPSATAAFILLSACPPCGGTSTLNLGSTVPVACGGANGGACPFGPANANLCWALNLGPGCWLSSGMISAGAGWFHIRFTIPPSTAFTGTLWAQALIVDPCSTGGWHMSNALGID
jgi:hypothetical protein